ncbi:MAG: sigma-70 family RNA polymerase sigma factor [Christensenellales bacterium]
MDNNKDLVLLQKIRQGDDRALEELMTAYKGVVSSLMRDYFLKGADKEDLFEEGWIGLYKAVLSYDADSGVTFYTYACSCIRNKLYDAIKKYNAATHNSLNESVDITQNSEIEDHAPSMEEKTMERQIVDSVIQGLNKELSELERNILRLYLDGESYGEIAIKVGKKEKFVDNTLQKIKRKIKKLSIGWLE